jgi:hypothetical protein
MEYEFLTCESFKYLGAIVTEKNDTNIETKARLVANNGVCSLYKKFCISE